MDKEHTLQETFEIDGYWWLPDSSIEDSTHGTVYFEPEIGIRLEIDGSPIKQDLVAEGIYHFKSIPRREKFPAIFGFTKDGRRIYLLNCVGIGKKVNRPGYEVSIYEAEYLLVSQDEFLFNNVEELKFQAFNINFTHLEEWVALSPILQESGKDENGDYYVQTQFVFKRPMLVPIFEFSDYSLSFTFSIDPPSHLTIKEKIWRQATYFDLEPHYPQTLLWLIEKVKSFQYLTSILLGEAVYPCIIKAFGEKTDKKAYVYYAVPRERWVETIEPYHILLSAYELGDQLGKVCNLWFEREEFIKPLSDNYLGIIYNKQLPVLGFLSLTQALEGYHRKRIGGQYFTEEEYEPFREVLNNAVSSFQISASEKQKNLRDMKQSLIKGCIRYGYQYSLLKRLKDLWATLDEELHSFFNFDKEYLRKIKDTRNYYTHYDPDDEPKALKGSDLQRANVRLTSLVLLLILRELEIPRELQFKVLERLQKTRRLE